MSNPLYKALGGKIPYVENSPLNLVQQVQKFRQDMQGKNPNEEISKLLQSGRISQQQLNQAQQMAYQMQGLFKNF